MDSPFLLLVLLALPLVVAAVIVASSSFRRRRRTPDGAEPEPRHRGQAETAAVQSATAHPRAAARKVAGRDRRAAHARGSARG